MTEAARTSTMDMLGATPIAALPVRAWARVDAGDAMWKVVAEMKAKGIEKPVVASLAGDVQVEEAAEYLFDHGIPAYPYSTEMPVMVLGAKYKWARGAGLI